MMRYMLLALSLLVVTDATCSVCSGLGDANGPINIACRYGEKVRGQYNLQHVLHLG